MGKLYIVATPIGNLEDITLRALATLRNVDLVLCEDTRTTGQLLRHFEISKPLLSLYDQNELQRLPEIRQMLQEDKNIALVSENGTPLISDPGYKLVRELIKVGIEVESLPGPSSIISALVVSGMPPDKFFFVGFLPKKESGVSKLLIPIKESWKNTPFTVIAFDSPFRVKKSLELIGKHLDNPYVVIERELTKTYEEIIRGHAGELKEKLLKRSLKGEIVLLINPKNPFEL